MSSTITTIIFIISCIGILYPIVSLIYELIRDTRKGRTLTLISKTGEKVVLDMRRGKRNSAEKIIRAVDILLEK